MNFPSQGWITKLAETDSNEPSVIGRSEKDDFRDSWLLRFIAKLIEVGIPISFAVSLYLNRDNDFDELPEEEAISELDAMGE
jgi:hypothetical protein